MSVSLVLWICYHVLAVPMAVWAAVSAAIGGPGVGARQRVWTALSAALLPPALAATALAVPLGHREFGLAGTLLPILTFAVIWANLVALRHARLGAKILHLPILGWNAALCAVYALRAVQEIAGLDAGTPGTSLLTGHAMVQSWVGRADAMSFPVWLHLPICLPVGWSHGWMHRLAFGTCATAATALLGLLTFAMPLAYQRSERFRAPTVATSGLRDDQTLAIAVGWDDPDHSEEERADRRAACESIGANALVFDVDRELFADEVRLRLAREQVAAAREMGWKVVAIARPPRELLRRPAIDVPTLAQEMAQCQWLTAERLAPDVLFLFAGPFGALTRYRAEIGTIDQWTEVLARAAGEVRQANPDVAPAVAIESRALHARRLFARLRDDDSPVASVGLIALPEQLPPDRALATFSVLEEWIESTRGERPIWLVDVGTCPATSGGDVGQWSYIARALALAERRSEIAGVCLRALDDGDGAQRGLRNAFGLHRGAFRELEARARAGNAEPPR